MPEYVPVNPELSTGYQVPGVYGYISLLGAGPSTLNRKILILAYKTSAGNATAGTPKRVNNEEEMLTAAGKGSDCLRIYRALLSQGVSNAEVWVCPMNAPSGTAQTRKITILAAAVSAVLGSNSTAQSAGIMSVWICGYRADVTIANGDTFATIAANLNTEILKIEDYLPCTTGVSSETVTLTARSAALTSADFPIQISFSNTTMAVAASPGTMTFTNTAGAGGSVTLYCETRSAAATINNADTVAVIGASMTSAINSAVNFPLSAAQASPATGVVTLYYAYDRVCNWLATAITPAGTITTTLALAVGNHAAGLPSSSLPSLSNALDNIASTSDTYGAFGLWITNFTGAGSFITDAAFTQIGSTTSYSNMGTIASFIESQGNGQNCKGQRMVFADSRSLTLAGAFNASTSPALTTSPRYFMGWCKATPQQSVEIAARMAGCVISKDYLPFNYAGQLLVTSGSVPLLGVAPAAAMSDADANSAMLSYFMTPVRMNVANQYNIVSGRTTAKPGAAIDVRFVFWGTINTVDYFRDDSRAYLSGQLAGKSLKVYSQPTTSNCVTPDSVKDLLFGRMLLWQSLDFFDGAERVKDKLQVKVNPSVPQRLDLSCPLVEPMPLEQASIYFQQVA